MRIRDSIRTLGMDVFQKAEYNFNKEAKVLVEEMHRKAAIAQIPGLQSYIAFGLTTPDNVEFSQDNADFLASGSLTHGFDLLTASLGIRREHKASLPKDSGFDLKQMDRMHRDINKSPSGMMLGKSPIIVEGSMDKLKHGDNEIQSYAEKAAGRSYARIVPTSDGQLKPIRNIGEVEQSFMGERMPKSERSERVK